MSGFRFAVGLHFLLQKRKYVITKGLLDGNFQVMDLATNECFPMPEDMLVDALFKGDMEVRGDGSLAAYADTEAAKSFADDINHLPTEIRTEVRRRFAYVREIVSRRLDTRTRGTLEPLIRDVAKESGDTNPPAWITLYRWYRDYRRSGKDVRVLVPNYRGRGNRTPKIDESAGKILSDIINQKYLKDPTFAPSDVLDTMEAKIQNDNRFRKEDNQIPLPSTSTVYRALKKLDPYDVTAGRHGKHRADMECGAFGQGPRPTRILERVEIDHTKLDIFVIDEATKMPLGRPWLTTAIDVHSKYIVGMYISFTPPSYLSVMECLRHAIKPKSYLKKWYPEIQHEWLAYGIPETVVPDNGKEFHSHDFEDACRQLGIEVQYAPVKFAWYKPSVERHFGSLAKGLLHRLPGTTFSNIFERKEYNSKKHAVISFTGLLELVHTWIVDVYHVKEHRGIHDVPERMWKAGEQAAPVALPKKSANLNVLLGMVEERKVKKTGIEFEELYYNGPELGRIRRTLKKGEKVTIKYIPTDMSKIYVYDRVNQTFIPVPAVNQTYTVDLTLWQHRVIRRYARTLVKKYVDIAALIRAKARIREIVYRELLEGKKSTTRQAMARWAGIAQPDYDGSPEVEPKAALPEPSFPMAADTSPETGAKSDPRGARKDPGEGAEEGNGNVVATETTGKRLRRPTTTRRTSPARARGESRRAEGAKGSEAVAGPLQVLDVSANKKNVDPHAGWGSAYDTPTGGKR